MSTSVEIDFDGFYFIRADDGLICSYDTYTPIYGGDDLAMMRANAQALLAAVEYVEKRRGLDARSPDNPVVE